MEKKKGRTHYKYTMGNQTLMEWCSLHGCSYAVGLRMMKNGKSEAEIKKALMKKYQREDADIYQAAESTAKKWKKANNPYSRQCVRSEFFADWGWHLRAERLWEEITLGTYTYEGERWLTIPGHIKYQASDMGRVRKKLKTGNYVILHPYVKDRCNRHRKPNRKSLFIKIGTTEVALARVIAETFIDHADDYNVVIVKDRNWKHIWVDNLEWVTKKQAGSRTGYSPKTADEIEQLDETGRVMHTFRSARQAAKELYISYQTVLDYCADKVKKPMYRLRKKRGNYHDKH